MRVILLLGLAVALSGCATTQRAGNALCARRDALEPILLAGLAKAQEIADPVKREAAIGGINVSLAALGRCPR